MSSTITPNMSLIVPTVGSEPGPTYAVDLNTSMTLIDRHDHSPGNGLPVTPAGLNINSALTFANNPALALSYMSMTAQNAVSTAHQSLSSTAAAGINELFYTDSNGVSTQITTNGVVNATAAAIPGESYNVGTFTWVQGAGSTTPAIFDIGAVIIRPNVAATTNGVRLVPNASIASQYDLTLPLIPSQTKFLTIDTAGIITGGVNTVNGLTTSNISLTAGITGGQIAAATIAATNIVNNTITSSQIAVGGINGGSAAISGNIANQSIDGFALKVATVTPSNLTSAGTAVYAQAYGGATDPTATIFTGSVAGVKNRPLMFNFRSTSVTNSGIDFSGGGSIRFAFIFNGVTFNAFTLSSADQIPVSALNCAYFSAATVSSFVYQVQVATISGTVVLPPMVLDVIAV